MLDSIQERCQTLLFGKLLDKWATHGLDPVLGYSYESLTKDWQANPVGRIRLLTQCRQLYTFSHAYLMTGNSRWLDCATPLYDFILAHYKMTDRWRFSLNDDLTPQDDSSDCYALAFILLSFSFYYQASADKTALEHIKQTDAFLQAEMAAENGGFYESYPKNPSTIRRQNPHMHLLEGYLAAYNASQEPLYKAQIISLLALAKTHFFDADSNSLREFFNDDWTLHQDTGHQIEPGHHFEWVWLLHQAYKIHPDQSYLTLADCLWQKAIQHGLDPKGGIYNQIDAETGDTIDAEKRIWPLTEYLKAICVQLKNPEAQTRQLQQILEFAFQHYFHSDGSWNEYLDENNLAKSFPLPGTSSYHIFLGLAEVIKWSQASAISADPSTQINQG